MKAQQKLVVAVCASIALGLLAMLVWTKHPGADAQLGVAPARHDAPQAAPRVSERAPLDADKPPVRETAGAPTAPAEGALHVVVLERAGGSRVADAELRFASDDELARVWDRTRSWVGTLEENLAALGHTVRTDVRGEAWITPSARPATVCARKGELWNYRAITVHGEGALSIELVQDRDLILRVVDRSGQPVSGVPVALLTTSPQGFTVPLWQDRTSGDKGLAVVRHVDVLLEAQPTRTNLAAGFDFMLLDPHDVALDSKRLPLDPVDLVLPPNGAVEVAFAVDSQYASIAGGSIEGEVWLEHADPKPPRGVFIQKARARDGRAEFSHVGVGLSLVVKGKSVFGFKPVTVRGSGPAKDGDRARFTLDLDDPYPALVGRLVDAQGVVLADRAVEGRTEVRREGDTQPAATFPARSDAQGAFRVVLQVPPLPGLEGTAFLKVYGAERSFEGMATLKLPAFLARGDNPVGDVTVEVVERVLAGSVVGANGEALPNVWVNVQRGEPLDGALERVRWLLVPELQSRSDRDGAFTILGRAPAGPLRVVVNHEGYLRSEGPEFLAGARDVRVRLKSSATIVGSVVTPDYFPLDVLHARIRPFVATDTNESASPATRMAPVLMDRTFQARELHAGRYSVDVMLQNDTRPLASFTDIQVAGGESVHDPRLVDVDLRDKVRCVRLRVEDAAGDPVAGANVWVGFGTQHERAYKVDGKEARAVFRDIENDLDIAAPGYRPVTLRNVVGDQSVVLSPRIEVELVLAAGTRVPDPPYHLGVKFRPLTPDGSEVTSPSASRTVAPLEPHDRLFEAQGDAAFASTGVLSALLAAPGSYRLEWSVSVSSNGVGSGSTFAPSDRDRIDVHDTSTLQTFEVAPDATQYARLLDELMRAWDARK